MGSTPVTLDNLPEFAPKRATDRPPRVSIGLPVYNGEKWLAESIDSLLSQTFSDLELVICDNASTDGTEAICRRYANQDDRVRYTRNPENIGGMRNSNLTFELARGEYFRWAADDDRCEPTLLARLVEALDRRPDVVVAVSPFISMDHRGDRLPNRYVGKSAGKLLSLGRHAPALMTDAWGVRYPTEGTAASPSRRFREVILTQCSCEGTYGLIRSDVLRRTRLLGPYTGSDVAMLGDLALHGRFHVLDEALFFKRWHATNVRQEPRSRSDGLVPTGPLRIWPPQLPTLAPTARPRRDRPAGEAPAGGRARSLWHIGAPLDEGERESVGRGRRERGRDGHPLA